MGKAERRKGVLGEQEVCNVFRGFGLACERVPNSGGLFIPGDVAGIEGYHVEVKRQERLDIPAWLRQARAEAAADDVPVVVFRRSREEWQAIVPLSTLAYLMNKVNRSLGV